MSFEADLKIFDLKLEGIDQAMVPAIGAAVHNSVVFGSPTTGAPGQVVADQNGGNLRGSWQLTFPTTTTAQSSTKVPYAESNEDGIARPGGGPYIQRSAIGGRWNVALTLANSQKLVDEVARDLAAGSGGRADG